MTFVYRFSESKTDGSGHMRNLLGGKGAGLAEMCRLGVPVPPGFTISTEACIAYLDSGAELSSSVMDEVGQQMAWLQQELGKSFAGDGAPLLLSVRSGARVSMPGMMDTILNLGLNDQTVQRLAESSGDARFAYDSYRRFITMFSDVVLGISHSDFETILAELRDREGASTDAEISLAGLKNLVVAYKDMVRRETGEPFPEDPMRQLWGAICAVFDSWNNPRAKFYRKIHDIADNWGTAVTVQSMVFGNMGEDSGTGVCFSRNPSTGEPEPYGEFLRNAQGEDVVAGIRTPHPIHAPNDAKCMSAQMPALYSELTGIMARLEKNFGDMQDIEFTFENGRLFLLQTRNGKRTSQAGLRIAIDLCKEGLIDEKEALRRIDPRSMTQLLASEFDETAKAAILREGKQLGKGLNAGPGAATGKVVMDAELATDWSSAGEDVILVRAETSPEDIAGMHVSRGILTQRGGMTSHAAVVARGMGKPCVVGCGEMQVDNTKRQLRFGDRIIAEGDYISIDGTTGEVILGRIPTRESALIQQLRDGDIPTDSQGEQFNMLMKWADSITRMTVRTNADTPDDATMARLLGATGIGLCRTEHMFFGEDRIKFVRKMILANDENVRTEALQELLPFQRNDFYELFKAMDGLPVTIRLLDPPLHEFLPHTDELIQELAADMRTSAKAIKARIAELHESNPMLGHRGCRLGISHPDIYQMQVSAVVSAAKQAKAEGITPVPEIMVPLIATKAELDIVKTSVQPIIDESGLEIPVGTMIEIPRAALTAGEIAETAAFFSFGTNDLTQCGMGLSRDDSGSFLPLYTERGILSQDPFKTIDRNGIGKLVQMASESGRQTRPDIKLGICGEHGGDPASIDFFHQAGLDYVSCSPYRVPVARLAAARASLGEDS